MATILDKDITRETNVKIDGREIQITLTEGQKISMKLKGMKSGHLEISIEDLYNQLRGNNVTDNKDLSSNDEDEDEKPKSNNDLSSYKGDSKYLISIQDIRHAANIRGFDLETTSKFDSFLADLIKDRKTRLK